MAFKFSPRIVTDGLIFYSDVSNPRSFISGNTSLNDISINQATSTLSAVTYNTNNINRVGSLSFSGNGVTGSYISYATATTYNLNFGSMGVFCKILPQADTVGFKAIFLKQYRYGLFAINNVLVTYDWGNSLSRPTTFAITDSAWHYIVMTFTDITGIPSNNARIYVDGNLVLTTTIKIFADDTTPLYLGYGNVSTQFLTGDITIAQLYNKVLSQQEILQNYNTLKSRFGK